jgi:nicotinamidase-related amidase
MVAFLKRFYRRFNKMSGLGVLLIDMQEDFLIEIDETERQKMIEQQKKILHACSLLDIPVIILEYSNHGSTIEDLQKCLDSVVRTSTITKPRNDGFVRTKLDKQLRQLGVGKLLLMGVNASACVASTGKGGKRYGYEIITSLDLIADPPDWEHNKSQDWYEENGLLAHSLEELPILQNNKVKI